MEINQTEIYTLANEQFQKQGKVVVSHIIRALGYIPGGEYHKQVAGIVDSYGWDRTKQQRDYNQRQPKHKKSEVLNVLNELKTKYIQLEHLKGEYKAIKGRINSMQEEIVTLEGIIVNHLK